MLFVATTVEALCAARMLKVLLDQEGIHHTILPISGFSELQVRVDEIRNNTDVCPALSFQDVLYCCSSDADLKSFTQYSSLGQAQRWIWWILSLLDLK